MGFKKWPSWRFIGNDEQARFIKWAKTYIANLTSCDFTLPQDELLVERVKTYAYVLSTLGGWQAYGIENREMVTDQIFSLFLDVSEKNFSRLRG